MNDLHSLAGEYAVGCLTEEETTEFESHLATCPDCREEVAEMRDIAVQLSKAVAAEPPTGLRASVLAKISQTAQDAPAHAGVQPARQGDEAADPSEHSEAPGVHVGGSAPAASNVVPFQRRTSSTWVAGILAAAAVLAAIAMGGWAVSNRDDARVSTAQNLQLTHLLTAGDVRTASGQFSGGGSGTVVLSASQHQALLVAADLPELPSGQVYEAWTITDSTTPAGTFTKGGSGTIVSLPPAAVDASAVAVTVEPEGGSDHPTSKPLFKVGLPTA